MDEMWITMQPGDTLASIATTYGTTIEGLIKRNRFYGPIAVGDTIIVPRVARQ